MTTNDSSSTTSQWLLKATTHLQAADVATARLDALVLLEDFTDRDRGWLLANPGFELADTTLLDKQVERRGLHEPLAYIRGKTEFYGREFLVNSYTLEPRPETETMVELLLDLAQSSKLKAQSTVVDVGTGSGCIAITAKLELPRLEVIGIDKDSMCLKMAKKNAKKLGADVQFYEGDGLEPLLQNMSGRTKNVTVCGNLPYVPDKYELNQAATFEPRHAIFGGPDGLDVYRKLFEQIRNLREKPKLVLTESLPFQHQELAAVARQASYYVLKTNDFIQVFSLRELPQA